MVWGYGLMVVLFIARVSMRRLDSNEVMLNSGWPLIALSRVWEEVNNESRDIE